MNTVSVFEVGSRMLVISAATEDKLNLNRDNQMSDEQTILASVTLNA